VAAETTSRPGPLAGITVVALEQAVSAPMASRTLADLGARVIKIENPAGGDFARHYDDVVLGQAAHFVWCNRGKESVTLDLKSAAGLGLLHRILDGADVLISNLAPGAVGRLGLGRTDLAERHPGLIALEIDGYGAGGPLSHKRAYDLLVQAEAGSCAVTGFPGEPAKPGVPMADVGSGLYAAITILSLLRERDAHGPREQGPGEQGPGEQGPGKQGPGEPPATWATVSLFDTMSELMGYPLTYTRASGVDQQPLGMGSPAVAPYGAFACADGATVVLGTTNDREWQRLALELLERPDLAADPRFAGNAGRVAHREALHAEIGAWCARHDLPAVQARADAAGIGNSRYNTPSEVVAHPHHAARHRWREVPTPSGPVQALLPPPVIAGWEPVMAGVPGLGEHTGAVLAELGLDADAIAKLRADGVIGAAYIPPVAEQPKESRDA
jgi:crotonobetainyl-CoA:carnitine CoA-transferase CaiB-like acyl-CoA transferase